jgi:hypothetical protein
MMVIYQTISLNGNTYITGWADANAAVTAGTPVPLDPILEAINFGPSNGFFDAYGNPLWQLNDDGSVSPALIIVSPTQIAVATQVLDINTLIPQIIDYVVSGDSIPQTLKSNWLQVRNN